MIAVELGQMRWNVTELLLNVYDNMDVEDVSLLFSLRRLLVCALARSEVRHVAKACTSQW